MNAIMSITAIPVLVLLVKRVRVAGSFGRVNYIVLGAYLTVLVAMGFYFAKRGRSTDDFFLAGRRIPWWAAGLSIFGTQLSAITYLAMPARAYAIVSNDKLILSLHSHSSQAVGNVYYPFAEGCNC